LTHPHRLLKDKPIAFRAQRRTQFLSKSFCGHLIMFLEKVGRPSNIGRVNSAAILKKKKKEQCDFALGFILKKKKNQIVGIGYA